MAFRRPRLSVAVGAAVGQAEQAQGQLVGCHCRQRARYGLLPRQPITSTWGRSWPMPLGSKAMPELTRFFGSIIAMYYNNHSPPHFHAK